jgi:hypothetical protein
VLAWKGIKKFLEKLKFFKIYLHFLLKNDLLLRIRNNKLADKGSQMTIAYGVFQWVVD